MLRLAPEGYLRFEQADKFCATFGGAEANVAVSLARFGEDARFVTKIPANPIGDSCIRALRAEGVDVSDIARGGDRLGIYYAERVRRRDLQRSFTTENTAPYRLPAETISIGKKFFPAQIGSISRA